MLSINLQWSGATVASWGYGFMVGKPARFGVSGMMAAIGFTFGSMVAVQNTRGRLMGFRENEREQKKYGIAEQAKDVPPQNLVRPKMDWKQFS